MSNFLLMNVGAVPTQSASQATSANGQLLFFENFPIKGAGNNVVAYSDGTLSIHGVNIPVSISFGNVIALLSFSSNALSNFLGSVQFGLYSLNNGTLSLANSAGADLNATTNGGSYISMITSATQNISPGAWYFGFNMFTSGVLPHTSASFRGNAPVNATNANPYFYNGRMTASTNAMPSAIATSDLDVTGTDANTHPLIIITA